MKAFELIQCRDDFVYWLENWVWTYNPRRQPAYIPFTPWPKQADLAHWLEDREAREEGGLAEKSRDSGVTVICGAFAIHHWLFRHGFSAGFGSRKEIYVDNPGDPDSIFEKLRIIIGSLPGWMLPRGYNAKSHATFCKLVNPQNGNTITGEAGDNIGRGGRKSIYFVDEAAFIERAHLMDRSLAGNTDVRIDISTPNGIGNPFYTKRFSGTVPVFTFNWHDDPRKTPEWVAKKKAEVGPLVWAQEYEIDYSASIEGVCIPAIWVQAAIGLKLPTLGGPQKGGYDIAEEGVDSNVIISGRGPVVSDIVAWGQQTTTQSAYRAVAECRRLIITELNYDSVGVGTGPKGIWMAMSDRDKALWENGPVIAFNPVNTGETPTNARWPDGKTSAEKFENLKAEAWWMLRTRFERTYEYVNATEKQLADPVWQEGHRVEDLISLPNHPQLIAELSTVKVEYTDKGKVKIESKKQLASRGVKSPDYAEALVLLFTPERKKLQAWVL